MMNTKKRRLEARGAIEVYRDEHGCICIKQKGLLGEEEDQVVLMEAVDVPQVIKWLEEVVLEISDSRA